jgi:hypothetical protein
MPSVNETAETGVKPAMPMIFTAGVLSFALLLAVAASVHV